MPTKRPDPSTATRSGNPAVVVVLLCWVFVLLDGTDLFVYGAVLPRILKSHALGITAGQAGDIGSYTTFGMLVGALCAGTVSDWIGRKKSVIANVTLFSLASVATAAAPSAAVFGGARLIAGLGLGGLLPTAIAYVMDYATPSRRNLMVGVLMTAHQTGGIVAATLGLWVVPSLGWRSVFWLGAVPAIVVVPLAVRLLPESVSFLVAKGRRGEAEALAGRYGLALDAPAAGTTATRPDTWQNLRALFVRSQWPTTLSFWAASFAGLLLVYGVSTWLPTMMRASGYELGSAVSFLLVINLGGIVGLLTAGRLSDRVGPLRVTIVWFALTAVGTGLFAVHMPLALTYLVVFLTGALLFSAQTMVYASVGSHHAPDSRATAVGWVAGMGRFGAVFGPWLGGRLVAADASTWGFVAFSIAGVVGAVMMAAAYVSIRHRPAPMPSAAVDGAVRGQA
ncbi:aromatic acid/H+ symport family MFS transporter [Actinoallomurus purpureus]|uniref:MFS transporter n=1 Tax=Actinoallomurus purpureus TaxID=478114 RepID=UPI0020922AFB|nr:aromatic acid/H+ symport family MFS transporter [Actinoallomurus purpureus]MCO6003629.1 aromatic acid/H+ symport family MFS transporter [Actinoallomurus purpureus]